MYGSDHYWIKQSIEYSRWLFSDYIICVFLNSLSRGFLRDPRATNCRHIGRFAFYSGNSGSPRERRDLRYFLSSLSRFINMKVPWRRWNSETSRSEISSFRSAGGHKWRRWYRSFGYDIMLQLDTLCFFLNLFSSLFLPFILHNICNYEKIL